ncbi:MAG: sulfatase-like hydrolase/transferase [Planctomycetota bacterium]
MNQISGSMNRRVFLKLTVAGAATFALSGCASASQQRVSKQSKRPNVLFIAIDDLNDWIGCLGGHPDVKTPNLDKLAQRGVLFTNAHCSAPACNPSRASLMTGILPSTSGVYLNPHPWRKSLALGKAVTLPQHFMANGYRVVGGGKIYHGSFPDPSSWQEYFPSQKKNKPDVRKWAIGKSQTGR